MIPPRPGTMPPPPDPIPVALLVETGQLPADVLAEPLPDALAKVRQPESTRVQVLAPEEVATVSSLYDAPEAASSQRFPRTTPGKEVAHALETMFEVEAQLAAHGIKLNWSISR